MTEGAYIMEKILSRCVEDGDCLLWNRSYNRRGPIINVDGKETSVRRLYWEIENDKEFPPHRVASTSCGRKLCLSHVVPMTWGQVAKATHRRRPAGQIYAERVAAHRAKGLKVSDEVVREIRYGEDHWKVLSEKYGISKGYVYQIRKGTCRPDHSNPFLGLGAR